MSSFGWLDTDPAQRRRMLEVVDLFKDAGSVDELGIGAIRDALSDALSPGTSVLHTRLRYTLFIPWLLRDAASAGTPEQMAERFRNSEFTLIEALLRGGETQNVIGQEARRTLKRLPSAVYWAAIGRWGLCTRPISLTTYFRRATDVRHLAERATRTEEGEAGQFLPDDGFDPHLPPPPDRWLHSVDFALTPAEEQYLSDRIAAATRGSLLSWLVHHEPALPVDLPWQLDNLHEAPGDLQETVDHARRFHTAIFGAALLYNLLVARKRALTDPDNEHVARYEVALEEWRGELATTGALDGWDRTAWWATIHAHNPNLNVQTRLFVDRWIDIISHDAHVEHNTSAARLIESREHRLKGTRARLSNQSALDRWNGRSGLVRLDYRWDVTQRHLQDLYAARRPS